ncbi:unnamed protein product [Miscanthus lutarioriparius]|uniref:START domain-containing protein n=1 Tax=Miscanthus lutarioriparius TaxID=422564 RepID=A0A811PWS8_9POAL|nr:unnamed protein product [Miscanthus lutarioriparius]
MAPPPLLDSTDLWRPVAAARGGGWATAAALLLLLASHLAVLLVRRRLRGGGRIAQPEAALAPAPASTPPGSASGLVPRTAFAAAGPPKYLSITTYERCSTEQLRDFYMDNEYRMEWDNTVTKHEQLQYYENSGVEVGRTIKKFPLLTPREYILAWRVWEANDKSFYCFIKECEHPLAARQRKFVRVRLLRSGWCIRKIPGRDACQITVLHHEDNGMNIEMAKLAFSKGIWSYICKMNNALRRYPQYCSPSLSILTMQKLMKKFPQDLEAADASLSASQNTAASVVPSTPTARTSPCKLPGKKSSRQMIASGLLLVGSIVCLSRGRSNLGAQLAMVFFLKKAFKQERESGSSTSRAKTDVTNAGGSRTGFTV